MELLGYDDVIERIESSPFWRMETCVVATWTLSLYQAFYHAYRYILRYYVSKRLDESAFRLVIDLRMCLLNFFVFKNMRIRMDEA